jgi:DnaJ family protein B protein 12
MRSGNLVRAVKLLSKSLQLYPLPGVDALLAQTMARVQQSQNASSTSSSAPRTQPTAQPPHRASSTASATSSSSAKTGRDGRAYTEDQVAICSQVLRAKEGGRGAHYRVLGISPSSDESQIKKGYRKLSLKVHPDKNSAPHSDEAFKAVGLAYATLSDPQKRTIYDRYGEEDPDNLGGGGARQRAGGMHMHQGQNVSPEEIFNMFFGGGMGGGGGGGGGPGFHFQSNGFGPGMQFRQQRQRGGGQGQRREAQQQQQQPSFGMLFQLLPIILILVVSFFKFDDAASVAGGSMPGVDRYFSLTVRQLSWCCYCC